MKISRVYRPLLIITLTLVVTGTSFAAFNFSDVQEVADNSRGRGGSLTSLGEGEGEGFYLAIYEDTVRNPNRKVEENIKRQFGIDFKVRLDPPQASGPYVFTDFFRDPFESSYKGTTTPSLKSSLQSDCVRIKAAQADDEVRRWQLVRKRLQERNNAFEEGLIAEEPAADDGDEVVTRELLNRLIGLVDKRAEEKLNRAILDIPEYEGLEEQEVLIRCYEDFSRQVDFELKLQSILNPTKKQMEVLQTFMNDRLDDFTDADSVFGSSFPRFDLLFDIDVVDFIVFGTPVSTDIGQSGQVSGPGKGPGGFDNFGQIASLSDDPEGAGTETGTETGTADGPGRESRAGEVSRPGSETTGDSEAVGVSPRGGFGSSTSLFAGPYCTDDLEGVDLDLSPVEAAEADAEGIQPPAREREIAELPFLETAPSDSSLRAEIERDQDEDQLALQAVSESKEGQFQKGLNQQALCEGTIGVDFGNDFLKLLFCINIGFEKTGKSWETTRDENCIACHIYRMNEMFEEYVLESSVRPHKNTGTIMESSICEDGYGDDIGFHFFLEWIPVKLFPDICYPEGGVTADDYSELVGYPEIVHRVDRPGYYIECDADFKEEKAQTRCSEALQGNQLTFEKFRQAYLSTINLEQPIQSIDDIDKSNIWVKLVGDQGVGERELHVFLYRMGQVEAQYQEDEVIPQDFKDRADALKEKKEAINADSSLIVDATCDQKVLKLMCLKGFYSGAQEDKEKSCSVSCDEEDTFLKLEDDITSERNRVMRIVEKWNTRSRDFNNENRCENFSGSGLIDSFWDTFEDKFDPGYYLETDYRKTQTTEEQITGQIATNTGFQDFESLFSEINSEVESIARALERQEQRAEFETDQERSLVLFSALAAELATFRTNFQAFTNWWSGMVDDKQFMSKGGERINVLQSYFEKLQ